MRLLEKYTGEKTYMFPNGALATPEVVFKKYPAAKVFAHVVETDENGEVMWAFQNLSAMRTAQNIDKTLSEAEAILALQEIINTPRSTESSPTAEERIAAALEYQNLTAE